VDNVFDVMYAPGVSYRDVFGHQEYETSAYGFDVADTALLFSLFRMYEAEALRVLESKLVIPAYDYVLKCAHTFNLLDARGAISVSERQAYIGRIRALARRAAATYLEQRELLGYPLLQDQADRRYGRAALSTATDGSA